MSTPDWIDVRQFAPASGNDWTAAFQAALAAAENGPPVYVAAGTYPISGTISGVNVRIVSDGPSSVITTSHPWADIFDFAGGYAEVSDLTLTASVVRTGGSFINSTTSKATFERLLLSNHYVGISSQDNIAVINDCEADTPVPGVGVSLLVDGWAGGGTVKNFVMRPPAAGYMPLAGIEIVQCGCATISDSNIMGQGRCLWLTPGSGQTVADVKVAQTYLDSALFGLLIAPTGTGNVVRTSLTSSWTSGHSNGIGGVVTQKTGTGMIAGLDLENHEAINNAGSGASFSGASDVNARGGLFANNLFGLWFSDTSHFTVAGARIGAYGGVAGNKYCPIVVASPTSDHFIIAMNRWAGNGGGFANSAAPTANQYIAGNVS